MWSRNPSSSHLGLNHQWHGWLFSSPPAVSQQLWLACHKALKLWCAPLLAKAVWIGEGIKMIKFQWMQQLIYHQGASSGDIYNDVYYLYKLYIYIIYLSVCVSLSLSRSIAISRRSAVKLKPSRSALLKVILGRSRNWSGQWPQSKHTTWEITWDNYR